MRIPVLINSGLSYTIYYNYILLLIILLENLDAFYASQKTATKSKFESKI